MEAGSRPRGRQTWVQRNRSLTGAVDRGHRSDAGEAERPLSQRETGALSGERTDPEVLDSCFYLVFLVGFKTSVTWDQMHNNTFPVCLRGLFSK